MKKLHRLIGLVLMAILVIAGAVIASMAGRRWWLGIAYPPSTKPLMQTTSWSPSAGAVARGENEPPLSRDEADDLLKNPQPATPSSIERGKRTFRSYCAVCHGNEGHGDGPVAKKMILGPPDLPRRLEQRTDGYLYATIRNGGIIMPPYGDRILSGERWDLVNYLRTIQESGTSQGNE